MAKSPQNPALVRAQGAFLALYIGEWAVTVAIGLVAFADGGAAAVGLVGLLRLLPAGLIGPPLVAFLDRYERERALAMVSAARAAVFGAIFVTLFTGAPIALFYGLAILGQIVFTPFRGIHSAMLPSLCRTTEELTSVNVVRGALGSISIVVGPLVAAGFVATTGIAWTFLVTGGLALLALVLLLSIRYERAPRQHRSGTLLGDLRQGIAALVTTPGLRLVAGLFVLQTAIRGSLTVFIVVIAIDLLGQDEAAAGVLQSALGVGAVLGALAFGALRIGALARGLAVGVALWSLPLIPIGLAPSYLGALLAVGVIGVGNAVVDATGFSLVPRFVPDAALARVFGALEGLMAVAVGLASLLTPVLIDRLGITGALLAVGIAPALVCAACWVTAGRLDERLAVQTEEFRLLRRVAMLRPLPIPVLELAASRAEHRALASGTVVFRAGEVGTAFFVIAEGAVQILDGERLVRTMHAGEGFGEVALLGDRPRTMTVVAESDSELIELHRDDFLLAVGSIGDAGAAAQAVMTAHLEHAPGQSES